MNRIRHFYFTGFDSSLHRSQTPLIPGTVCFFDKQIYNKYTKVITLFIPGFKKETYQIAHVVFDFNGTLAIEGKLIEGVKDLLTELSQKVQLHVVTGNTFHTAEHELEGIPCRLTLLPHTDQGIEKERYIRQLGADSAIAIGNGRNDKEMLRDSAIGIVLLQAEGAAADAVSHADIISKHIFEAIDLVNHPRRIAATLRG